MSIDVGDADMTPGGCDLGDALSAQLVADQLLELWLVTDRV